MFLKYKTLVRVEVDPVIINTLKRKGWVEFTPDPPAPVDSVPKAVALWQLKAQLRIDGKLSAVVTAINALSARAKAIAESRLESQYEWSRNDTQLVSLLTSAGLNSAAIDTLFTNAATL